MPEIAGNKQEGLDNILLPAGGQNNEKRSEEACSQALVIVTGKVGLRRIGFMRSPKWTPTWHAWRTKSPALHVSDRRINKPVQKRCILHTTLCFASWPLMSGVLSFQHYLDLSQCAPGFQRCLIVGFCGREGELTCKADGSYHSTVHVSTYYSSSQEAYPSTSQSHTTRVSPPGSKKEKGASGSHSTTQPNLLWDSIQFSGPHDVT